MVKTWGCCEVKHPHVLCHNIRMVLRKTSGCYEF